jgi:hypothetical protein
MIRTSSLTDFLEQYRRHHAEDVFLVDEEVDVAYEPTAYYKLLEEKNPSKGSARSVPLDPKIRTVKPNGTRFSSTHLGPGENDCGSPFTSIFFVQSVLEILQALNGSRSAFTTCQDRKRYLATFRTIRVPTEQTFRSEKRPV